MTFQELLKEVRKIPSQEIRISEAHYLEMVMQEDSWPTLDSVLRSYFGMPLKPEGESPSADAKEYAAPYGGVHTNQTLYYRKDEKVSDVALLWPWGSGTSLTLKLIHQ